MNLAVLPDTVLIDSLAAAGPTGTAYALVGGAALVALMLAMILVMAHAGDWWHEGARR